jgi:hypothetical protein
MTEQSWFESKRLRRQAEQCFRLMKGVNDRQVCAQLLAFGRECEARAVELESEDVKDAGDSPANHSRRSA